MTSGEGSALRRKKVWERPLAVKGYRAARRTAERVGLQVVLKTYYSPIPDLAQLPANVWEARDDLRGIAFDLDAQIGLVEQSTCPHRAGLTSGGGCRAGARLRSRQRLLPARRCSALYAMLRHLLRGDRGARLWADDACDGPGLPRQRPRRATGRVARIRPIPDGRRRRSSRPRTIEPYESPGRARRGLFRIARGRRAVRRHDAHGEDRQAMSTRSSSVCCRCWRPGVVVHVHDIFLPYEYCAFFFADYGLYWAEQYLLQAFLAFNSSFEVSCAARAQRAVRRSAGRGRRQPAGKSGSSFWLRRVA